MRSTSILFFGTPEFALPALRGLIDAGYSIAGVVTQPDMPVGRKHELTPPPVKRFAHRRGILVFQPEKLDTNFKLQVSSLKADLFVVAAYGKMIPADLLAIPRLGAINIHPSLLPRWRGPSPIQTAILHGDKETGVTIMKMDAEMDHGPILANDKLHITNYKITYPELHDQLAELGAKLLMSTLPRWIAGALTPIAQDDSQATYCALLTKNSGKINWEKPAEEIERTIGAYHPWPGTWTIWKTDAKEWRVRIEDADVVPAAPPVSGGAGMVWQNEKYPLLVQSGYGSLVIKKLGMEGKSVTDAASFLRGHPSLIGSTLA